VTGIEIPLMNMKINAMQSGEQMAILENRSEKRFVGVMFSRDSLAIFRGIPYTSFGAWRYFAGVFLKDRSFGLISAN
jgi:hypothetical protein